MSIRLIDTTSLGMKVFVGEKIPKYAILSHTWSENEEVDFQEMTALSHDPQHPARLKSGYEKIRTTCEKARLDEIKFAWVDTCCINQSSSAELSEAINSMFRWYKQAEVCYAFLSDLAPNSDVNISLKFCRWSSRGFTLQELLAPSNLRFYNSAWEYVGDKYDLRATITAVTGIAQEVLRSSDVINTIPIACRMCWASKRTTTRVEDLAYCLLGIFDVNMPLLYGEGPKAFIRLQEEIIKRSNDLSVFWNFCDRQDTVRRNSHPNLIQSSHATNGHNPDGLRNLPSTQPADLETSQVYTYRNLFADTPHDFLMSSNIFRSSLPQMVSTTQDFALTNYGMRFDHAKLSILHTQDMELSMFYLLKLGYCNANNVFQECAIVLEKIRPRLFVRCHLPSTHRVFRMQTIDLRNTETVYIINSARTTPSISQQIRLSQYCPIRLDMVKSMKPAVNLNYLSYDVIRPLENWNAPRREFLTIPHEDFGAIIRITQYLATRPSPEEGRHLSCYLVLCSPSVTAGGNIRHLALKFLTWEEGRNLGHEGIYERYWNEMIPLAQLDLGRVMLDATVLAPPDEDQRYGFRVFVKSTPMQTASDGTRQAKQYTSTSSTMTLEMRMSSK